MSRHMTKIYSSGSTLWLVEIGWVMEGIKYYQLKICQNTKCAVQGAQNFIMLQTFLKVLINVKQLI